MIKLMIVDDESSIRRGLKHYIDWNAWEYRWKRRRLMERRHSDGLWR